MLKLFPALKLILLLTIPCSTHAQKDSLRVKIESLVKSLDARVGVSIFHLETNDTLTCNGTARLPMLSVYKFPIATAVLMQVDSGKLKMEQMVTLAKEWIHPGDEETFSLKNFPDGKATIKDLLTLMLVYGSNSACDLLLNEIGGPENVQRCMRKIGINNMEIVSTEKEIQTDVTVKYKNRSATNNMIKLLVTVYKKGILSKNSHSFLWDKMTATVTGPDRIKGSLPKDAKVAHRTGTANDAYNDAGIIELPNGKHIAIAVFISDAKEYPGTCNKVIAGISKLAWDYYAQL